MTPTRLIPSILAIFWALVPLASFAAPIELARYRSPVDLVLAVDGQWLATANQTSNSISLIELSSGKVLDEQSCGKHPTTVVRCLDGRHILVSCAHSGTVELFEIERQNLKLKRTIDTGFEPTGLAVSPNGKTAYVGLVASGEVAELDLNEGNIIRKISVGAWPRYLAMSPNGSTLAVACSGESKIYVVDLAKGEVAYAEKLSGGINIGHMQCSADGKHVYFPWMIYRSNPITQPNIRRGWVLGSRIGRVSLTGPEYREAITLDVSGTAVADPHGLAISGNQKRLVVAASGSHELLVYRLNDIPWEGVGGPGDFIDSRLMIEKDRFGRIDLGGRPMGLVIAGDNKTAYVANYLKDVVQVVDIESRKLLREIPLAATQPITQIRQGEMLFYDGQRSLDQWYSCHSCHYNGGVNSKAMDTWNDGSALTMKTVLPLDHVDKTGPWTWHGWQADLHDAMHKSFTSTMQGREVNEEEKDAILAYLSTNRLPPNPFRDAHGSLNEAAQRGKKVFQSETAACASCHSGKYFTDGGIHDIGLGSDEDEYDGFNTPTLIGLYRKVRFLHDGRAKTLAEVLTEYHSPEKVSGTRALKEEEVSDLIEYLKSL